MEGPYFEGNGGSGNGKTLTVDVAAMLKELAAGGKVDPEGAYTTTELVDMTGYCKKKVREMVGKAINQGACRCVNKSCVNIAGRHTQVPAYIFEVGEHEFSKN